ncbi:MAG: hypothetical protein U1C49_01735 [Candidatus Andersenbacteria bacterium]|nr:hypothetical protein [bacterium]MDZ4225547.1 hypothetical protein [Candidatus Andersenbacteria bacterium]
MQQSVEVVPAILRKTYEKLEEDWEKVRHGTNHIQVDITDGVFAGDGSFRDIRRLKQLVESQKTDLHLMVHTPANYVDDVIDLNPARCIFHIEAFEGTGDTKMVYEKLRSATQSELSLALNPDSPMIWLEEHLSMIDFVTFLGYMPGFANQEIDPRIFNKIAEFRAKNKEARIAVDGHVDKETIGYYVKSGASLLYTNTAIFGSGEPQENLKQLQLLAEAAL